MATKVKQPVCRDCQMGLISPESIRIGLCADCREKHKAAWKAEHTRQGPQDKRSGWLIGDLCTVKLRGQQYDAKIIDMSDISVADKHNYWLTQLELTKTVKGLDGKEYSNTWTHPEPVQTYKLKKRYVA